MSSGLTYIIFGAANFFGPQLAPTSLSDSGSVPSTVELAWQQQATRYGYTYTPGVGTHKVHTTPSTWNQARRICKEEGAHLAIINSVAEANTIAGVLRKLNSEWGYIGFHDLFQEGDYVTVNGESLASTGFEKWYPGEPNNSGNRDHCGGLRIEGRLSDERCNHIAYFVCELPHDQPVVIQHQTSSEATQAPIIIDGV